MAKAARKRGLGRGLDALIPQFNLEEDSKAGGSKESIKEININKIFPNKDQPRKNFRREALEELARSIEAHGLIQPVVVIGQEEGYMIVAGERRWRAAKIARLDTIPCIVKEYRPQQLIEIALVENLQREELNILEEARAYRHIIDSYKVTQEQLGNAIGKSRSYIANVLRLLNLDDRVMKMIVEGDLSQGHGRALLAINKGDQQFEAAQKIVGQGLSVRQVEKLVKELASQGKKTKKTRKRDPILEGVEKDLERFFGTRVKIKSGRKKGRIEIEYYGEEDLERIVSMLNKNS